MIRKVAAVFSILIAISLLGMWGMIILTGGITEGSIEISFHLVSEFLMAFLLLIGGIGLLREKVYGTKVFLISNGMLTYSVLNAAGYYGQRNNFVMLSIFIAILIISSVFLISGLVKDSTFLVLNKRNSS
jgi:hypothetical protein